MNALEDAITASKTLVAKEDATAEELTAQVQELQTAVHKVSAELYKQESAQAESEAPPSGGGGAADGPDVVDAEFTEEK